MSCDLFMMPSERSLDGQVIYTGQPCEYREIPSLLLQDFQVTSFSFSSVDLNQGFPEHIEGTASISITLLSIHGRQPQSLLIESLCMLKKTDWRTKV